MFFIGPFRIGNLSPEAAYAEGARLFNEKKSRAFPYLKYAAEQGIPIAQYAMGSCYKDGLGCKEDPRKTLYWYEKAAQQGYYRAQYEAAQVYDLGQGVPADKKKALYWYEKAAETGKPDDWLYSHVLFTCALYYEEGRGCQVDLKKALKWQVKHYDVCTADLVEAMKKGREGSIEILLDRAVKSLETIHRLRTNLGCGSDAELKMILFWLVKRVDALEEDILERLEKGSCRPVDISVDSLVKRLENIRRIWVQLGSDAEKKLISETLERLFIAVMEEFHKETTDHGNSKQAYELYQRLRELYEKIHLYIHASYGTIFNDGAVS